MAGWRYFLYCTVQGPCGMNKLGALELRWQSMEGTWLLLAWVHWIKLGHKLERNKDRIYMHFPLSAAHWTLFGN